jgi:hypothetical protein
LISSWTRLRPSVPAPPTDEHADIDRVVAYWDGSAAVRRWLDALAQASASVVSFHEHLPQNLDAWQRRGPQGHAGSVGGRSASK